MQQDTLAANHNKRTVIVTIASNKGGPGKSTTAVNLAHCIARNGESVLIIDADTQANASDHVGKRNLDLVFDMLDCTKDADGVHAKHEQEELVLATGIPNLDIICGGRSSSTIQYKHMSSMVDTKDAVELIRRASYGYDYVIIDTPPDGYMQQIALAAADVLIIPFAPSTSDIKGMEVVIDLSKALSNQTQSPAPEVIILPVKIDMRERESQDTHAWLRDHKEYGSRMAEFVPKAADISSAQSVAQTIIQYSPRGKAAAAYEKLAERVCMEFTCHTVGMEV